MKLANSEWIFAEKINRLHRHLFLNLNKGMAAKCRVDDQNGFEMWRKSIRQLTPHIQKRDVTLSQE